MDDPVASAPTLSSDRLVLSAHRPGDLDGIAAIWAEPETMRFMGRPPFSREECWMRTLRHAGSWSMLGFGFWVVRDRSGGEIVGEVGFSLFERAMDVPMEPSPEAGWVIAPWMHGQGLAREAMMAALTWADGSLKAGMTQCMISPENLPSLRLAAALGYAPSGVRTYRGSSVALLSRPRCG